LNMGVADGVVMPVGVDAGLAGDDAVGGSVELTVTFDEGLFAGGAAVGAVDGF